MLLIGLLLVAPLFTSAGAETTIGPDLYPKTWPEATPELATESHMNQVPDFITTEDSWYETTSEDTHSNDVFTNEDLTVSEEWTTALNEPESSEQTSTQDTASTGSEKDVTTLVSPSASPVLIETTTTNADNDTAVAQRQDSQEQTLLVALIVVSVIAGVALIAVVILAVCLFRGKRNSSRDTLDMEPVNPQDVATNHKKYVRWGEALSKDPSPSTELSERHPEDDPTQPYFNMDTEMPANAQVDANRVSNVYMNYGETAGGRQQTEDRTDKTCLRHDSEDTREVYANFPNDSGSGENVQDDDHFQDFEDYQNFKSSGR